MEMSHTIIVTIMATTAAAITVVASQPSTRIRRGKRCGPISRCSPPITSIIAMVGTATTPLMTAA